MKLALILLGILTLIACTWVWVEGENNTISTDTGVGEIAPIGKLGK